MFEILEHAFGDGFVAIDAEGWSEPLSRVCSIAFPPQG
jgi:hypothetical protein